MSKDDHACAPSLSPCVVKVELICRELLGLADEPDSCIPELRTDECYKKRPCVELVGCAAGIMEDLINKIERDKDTGS